MEENARYCDMCGYELENGDGTWVDDQLLCESCVEEHCTTCDHCGETIWANDAVEDDNITLCQTCYDDHYHRCECCGRIIHDNSTNWQGDMPYCDSCYDEFNDEIEEYVPAPNQMTTSNPYIPQLLDTSTHRYQKGRR